VASLAAIEAHVASAGLPSRGVRLQSEGNAIAATLPEAVGGAMLFHET
jgi:hypothetical protein